MVADPHIDAIWLCGPNHKRIENLEEIVAAVRTGRGSLVGVAIEKPLARNAAEALRVIELLEEEACSTGASRTRSSSLRLHAAVTFSGNGRRR
jgi:predicted dehydrogenase